MYMIKQAEGTVVLVNRNYNGFYVYYFQDMKGCRTYFKTDNLKKYAMITYKKELISLPSNDRISNEVIEKFSPFMKLNNDSKIDDFFHKHSVDLLQLKTGKCFVPPPSFDMVKAQECVGGLNVELEQVGFEMLVDFKFAMKEGIVTEFDSDDDDIESILLCLYTKKLGSLNQCVSSVEISIGYDNNAIEILSRTKKEYEGKKYNKLLRAVAILLAGITNQKKVKSEATNPTSAWLFLNTFHAKIETVGKKKPPLIRTYSDLLPLMEGGRSLMTSVDVTDETNLANAKSVFSECVRNFVEEKESLRAEGRSKNSDRSVSKKRNRSNKRKTEKS